MSQTVILTSQAGVDTFPILLNNPKAVDNLIIGFINFDTTHSDIHDLSPLSSLEKIYGDLIIRNNPKLKSLYGLHNVDTIITAIRGVEICQNDSLINLSGLSNLQYVSGEITIGDNPGLVSLKGLEKMTFHEDEIHITDNVALQSLEGLENLEVVGHVLYIKNTALTNIHLPKLRRAGLIVISDNPFLESLTGLIMLDTIANHFVNNIAASSIKLVANPKLKNLDGLENIVLGKGGNIWIQSNPLLENADALSSLQTDSLFRLFIHDNTLLQTIHIPHFQKIYGLEISDNPSLVSIHFPDFEYCQCDKFILDELLIQNNSKLTSIQMPMLKKVDGDFTISNNPRLPSLEGLGNIENITEGFYIIADSSLTNLKGIETLKEVGSFVVYWNPALTSLCDFKNFKRIGGYLTIGPNAITSFDGLGTLNYVGEWLSLWEPFATDISALSKIDSVGWDTTENGGISLYKFNSLNGFSITDINLPPDARIGISFSSNLESFSISNVSKIEALNILENPNLENFSFPSLTHIGADSEKYRYISIRDNPALTTLDGFPNLEYLRDTFSLRDNPSLSDCDAICRMLDRGIEPWRFKMSGNDFPCNSIADIEAHICDTLTTVFTPEKEAAAFILAYPNPTTSDFQLSIPKMQLPAEMHIYASTGKRIRRERVTSLRQHFQIAGLPPGIYYIHFPGLNAFGKLIKTP